METKNTNALQNSPSGAGGFSFKHVSYLWNDEEAAKLAGDEVALLIYRSNLLGADLRLTNYGGGNTSCKTKETLSVMRRQRHPATELRRSDAHRSVKRGS